MNDRDFDVVARNAILLLIALVCDDINKATDCMIHVWYSALLTEGHTNFLRQSVRTLVEDVCAKIATRQPSVIQAKTWCFSGASLRLELTKDRWAELLQYFDAPAGLTTNRADQIRTAVTLAYERRDHRDRALFALPYGRRTGMAKFREDGLLLPFGASRAPFTVSNPTIFQTADWPMPDSADPLSGWDYIDVLTTPYGPASNDTYGKLFTYLKGLLSTFYRRLFSETTKTEFRLLCVDAENLRDYAVQYDVFDRVEVSRCTCSIVMLH
jgi:hypothetical protein